MTIRTNRDTRQFFLTSFYGIIILGGFTLFYLALFDILNVSKDSRGFIAVMSFAVVFLIIGIGFGSDDEKVIPKMLRLLILFAGGFVAIAAFRPSLLINVILSVVAFSISIAVAKLVKKHKLCLFTE